MFAKGFEPKAELAVESEVELEAVVSGVTVLGVFRPAAEIVPTVFPEPTSVWHVDRMLETMPSQRSHRLPTPESSGVQETKTCFDS